MTRPTPSFATCKVLLAWAAFSPVLVGCLTPQYHFEIKPYSPVEIELIPSAVANSFKQKHPSGTILRAESRFWPPLNEEHYLLTFDEDGVRKEVRYNKKGKESRNSLRTVPTIEEEVTPCSTTQP